MSQGNVEESMNEFIAEANTALSGAGTPEEAYKRFMAVAGKGMMQVMANALAAATGDAVGASSNSSIEGWENYITGCTVDMNFGSPSYGTIWLANAPNAQNVPNTTLQASVTPASQLAGFGGSITVGGVWNF